MKKRHVLLIPVLASALLLAGCASDSKKIVNLNLRYITASSAPVNATDKNAQAQLSEAATSVGHSLQQLSAMNLATHPGVRMRAPANPAAIGMAQSANLNWNGPVQPLLEKIASAAHYKLRVLGNRPAVAVMVDVSTPSPRPLAEILRNVRYQVAGKATISVYPRAHVIELRYNNN